MKYLNATDYTVIIIYFSILVGLGFYLQKKAAASLEDYFLGGRLYTWNNPPCFFIGLNRLRGGRSESG